MNLQSPVAGAASAATAVGRPLSQSATVLSGLEEKQWAALICNFAQDGHDLLPWGSQEVAWPAGSLRNPKRRADYVGKQGRTMDWQMSGAFSPCLNFPKQPLHSSSFLSFRAPASVLKVTICWEEYTHSTDQRQWIGEEGLPWVPQQLCQKEPRSEGWAPSHCSAPDCCYDSCFLSDSISISPQNWSKTILSSTLCRQWL